MHSFSFSSLIFQDSHSEIQPRYREISVPSYSKRTLKDGDLIRCSNTRDLERCELLCQVKILYSLFVVTKIRARA